MIEKSLMRQHLFAPLCDHQGLSEDLERLQVKFGKQKEEAEEILNQCNSSDGV